MYTSPSFASNGSLTAAALNPKANPFLQAWKPHLAASQSFGVHGAPSRPQKQKMKRVRQVQENTVPQKRARTEEESATKGTAASHLFGAAIASQLPELPPLALLLGGASADVRERLSDTSVEEAEEARLQLHDALSPGMVILGFVRELGRTEVAVSISEVLWRGTQRPMPAESDGDSAPRLACPLELLRRMLDLCAVHDVPPPTALLPLDGRKGCPGLSPDHLRVGSRIIGMNAQARERSVLLYVCLVVCMRSDKNLRRQNTFVVCVCV